MSSVPGASQYRIQATLSNIRGTTFTTPNILGENSSLANLLTIGRDALAISGIGLSSNARALNDSFVEAWASDANGLFSLTGGTDGTVDGAKTQISALRTSVPQSQLSRSLRGEIVDEQA